MPPPAEGFATRFVLGPALRAQPDGRLVTLVRDGYETAFEEIVRRYGKPLTRYAAAIVGARGEDVTQDAFSKALLALRRDSAEIELRPWLFRIVRNTALNELRDHPPSPELLAEAIAGGDDPAEAMERREELADLMRRLRSLPEPQRAAIVMREMEGLSHEEIAAALGVSGGAARQAIHRARQALRSGAGMLLPLPLLRLLIDHADDAAALGAGSATVAATGGAVGGAGAGMALKAGVVTAVLAGSVGAGIAVNRSDHGKANADAPTATRATTAAAADSATKQPVTTAAGPGPLLAEEGHGPSGPGHSGPNRGQGRRGDDRGNDEIGSQHSFAPSANGPGPGVPASERHGRGGHPGEDDHGRSHPPRQSGWGEGHGGGSSHSGPGSGEDRSGGGHSGRERSDEGRGDDGEGEDLAAGSEEARGHHGPGGDGPGGDEIAPAAPPAEEEPREGEDGSGSGSSGSGSSGRGGGELP